MQQGAAYRHQPPRYQSTLIYARVVGAKQQALDGAIEARVVRVRCWILQHT